MKKLMLSVFALAAVAFSANAVDATQTGTGKVDLVAPMSLEKVDGSVLNFGRFAFLEGTGGVIAVSATENASTITTTGTDLTEVAGGDAQSLAAFKVTGTLGYAFAVTYDATLNLADGVDITAFNTNLTNDEGSIITGGTTFYVGGILTVGPAAVADTYSADFTVNVNYN